MATDVDSAGKYCVWRRRKLILIAGLHKVSKFKAPGVLRNKFDAEDPQILGSTAKI